MVKLLRVALGEENFAETGESMIGTADSEGLMKKQNLLTLQGMAHRG